MPEHIVGNPVHTHSKGVAICSATLQCMKLRHHFPSVMLACNVAQAFCCKQVTGDIKPPATASIVEHTEQPLHAHHANAKQLELVTRLSRNMSYMLPHRYLKRAYAYHGERERARLALQKLLTGKHSSAPT
jgi:hypothetical protein